jgi:propionyl-CoA synthetase
VPDASRPPFYRRFSGGRLNTCWNAVDRHVASGRGERVALIWDSPVTGQIRHFVYRELRAEVAHWRARWRASASSRATAS